MAKRKRVAPSKVTPKDEADYRPGNSKLAINSYEDVGNSEDEFHLGRDKVLLEETPDVKKRRRLEQDVIEHSDEEVLAYSASDDVDDDALDEEDDDEEAEGNNLDSASGSEDGNDKDDPLSGWGTSKSDYYNADEIETEEQARQEEEEARRLQKERRKALSEADFAFNEDDWKDEGDSESASKRAGFSETISQLEVSEDMPAAERLKLLKSRYPEFEPLSKDLMDLSPLHKQLADSLPPKDSKQSLSIEVLKFRALSAYLGSVALYFAVLTTGEEAVQNGKRQLLPPFQLREHEVMDFLVQSRERWNQVKDLQLPSPPATDDSDLDVAETAEPDLEVSEARPKKSKKAAADAAIQASQARRAARQLQTEQALAELDQELSANARKQKVKKSKAVGQAGDVDSDIGDEEELTAHEAAEKARKRKSLRFYTSQIAQKANKRAHAGRAAGGDDDLPHRERLRDRQERLTKEAIKRGSKPQDEDLGADSGDEGPTNREREEQAPIAEDDEHGKSLLARANAKKNQKRQREDVYQKAKELGGRVVRHEQAGAGPDGRRNLGWKIEANKGLTPKRNKLNKNPRAKKRAKYEEKTKKLRSMKPTYRGGEGRGGYGGELTGIKKGLVRSTKL